MYNIFVLITILGLIAGGLTTFSLVPQLLRIIRTKHTKDLSLNTYIILTVGVFLWFVYGLFVRDAAVIVANAVTFIFALSIVLYKIKYG